MNLEGNRGPLLFDAISISSTRMPVNPPVLQKCQENFSSQNEGKIIMHIGLPKTATTTLQTDLFPKLTQGVRYLGINQPRGTKSNDLLFNSIYQSIVSGTQNDQIRQAIRRELEKGNNLLFSEEMVTVSDSAVSWRKRLENLAQILKGVRHEIIVTVREPVSALFSYYCEIFKTLPRADRDDFMNCILTSENMEIFHYEKLSDELLKNFEKNRIHVIKFEDIINKQLDGLISIINPEMTIDSAIQLPVRNSGDRQGQFQLANYWITMGTFLEGALGWDVMGSKSKHSESISARTVRKLIIKLDRFRLYRVRAKCPSQQDIVLLRQVLQKGLDRIEHEFAVKYEHL